ncbi:hypothetical protein HH310_28835 [Actinoplanes sp. TBRC 11911]|uniref:hypothetical protein n=1 Tax=Actinoplanes sp. TBRC 11911 TaxID=2729386 RepID=UPI00145E8A11|nr:hypothetical protein [Actinoplanes sp. TBRC 11911]NMO55178.1 hypothetical protein [Actinoplanes sp. TBRC 11911]
MMVAFKVRGTDLEPHVHLTVGKLAVVDAFMKRFKLTDREAATKILSNGVMDAMELLGSRYVTSMTQVVGRLTRLREAIHVVYEKVLAGTGETVNRDELRMMFDQLHEETKKLADPQKWAQEEGRLVEPLPDTAAQPDYPGARPGLADKPTNAPREGAPVLGRTGKVWGERKVRRGEITLEIDADGLYWKFPDIPDDTVLHFEEFGYRVWKEADGAIVEELLVGPSVSSTRRLTRGEEVIFRAAEMGEAYEKAGTQRAHGAGSPGLGFDAVYGVVHAIARINNWLENHGVEAWVRRLRDNAPPGVEYVWTTRTRKSGQSLADRQYHISAVAEGKVHDLYTIDLTVPEGPPDPNGPINVKVTGVGPEILQYGSPPTRKSLEAWEAAPANEKPPIDYVEPPDPLKEALGHRTGPEPVRATNVAVARAQNALKRLTRVLDTTILKRTYDQNPAWNKAIDAVTEAVGRIDRQLATRPADPALLGQIDAAITAFDRRAQWATPDDLYRFAADLHNLARD